MFWGSPPVEPSGTLKGRTVTSDPMALHIREAQQQAEEAVEPIIIAEEIRASAGYRSECVWVLWLCADF